MGNRTAAQSWATCPYLSRTIQARQLVLCLELFVACRLSANRSWQYLDLFGILRKRNVASAKT
eukprot:3047414-Pleurochrysis_carterae.AAC.1